MAQHTELHICFDHQVELRKLKFLKLILVRSDDTRYSLTKENPSLCQPVPDLGGGGSSQVFDPLQT